MEPYLPFLWNLEATVHQSVLLNSQWRQLTCLTCGVLPALPGPSPGAGYKLSTALSNSQFFPSPPTANSHLTAHQPIFSTANSSLLLTEEEGGSQPQHPPSAPTTTFSQAPKQSNSPTAQQLHPPGQLISHSDSDSDTA